MARLVPAQIQARTAIGQGSPTSLRLPHPRDQIAALYDLNHRLTFQSGLPLIFYKERPLACRSHGALHVRLAIKRGIDVVLSAVALALLAPALLLIAAVICLTSPGPALFSQVREGLRGAPFRIYKFRTMYVERCDPAGLLQALPDDPRVTPFGRFLRHTALDELPQLFNVLKNEMSLVGPRPHVPAMSVCGIPYACLVPHYSARLAMKPGLSGWAQANGFRGPVDDLVHARARIDHDLAYIENFSLLLDLRILWRTMQHEIHRGWGSQPCNG